MNYVQHPIVLGCIVNLHPHRDPHNPNGYHATRNTPLCATQTLRIVLQPWHKCNLPHNLHQDHKLCASLNSHNSHTRTESSEYNMDGKDRRGFGAIWKGRWKNQRWLSSSSSPCWTKAHQRDVSKKTGHSRDIPRPSRCFGWIHVETDNEPH